MDAVYMLIRDFFLNVFILYLIFPTACCVLLLYSSSGPLEEEEREIAAAVVVVEEEWTDDVRQFFWALFLYRSDMYIQLMKE